MDDQGLYAALIQRGMTRRSFLKFSSAMAAALALPASYAPRIARAVEAAPRLPVIWVRAQTCGGNTESLIRSPDPKIETLLLDTISLEYHQSLLPAAVPGLTSRARPRWSATRTDTWRWSRAPSRTGRTARTASWADGRWRTSSGRSRRAPWP